MVCIVYGYFSYFPTKTHDVGTPRGASDEYPEDMFTWENKEKFSVDTLLSRILEALTFPLYNVENWKKISVIKYFKTYICAV